MHVGIKLFRENRMPADFLEAQNKTLRGEGMKAGLVVLDASELASVQVAA